MLEFMEKHLCSNNMKIYDPWVKRDIVKNQCHSLDEFLASVDLVVILVGHSEIKENMQRLAGKLVLDTRKVCDLDGVYRL